MFIRATYTENSSLFKDFFSRLGMARRAPTGGHRMPAATCSCFDLCTRERAHAFLQRTRGSLINDRESAWFPYLSAVYSSQVVAAVTEVCEDRHPTIIPPPFRSHCRSASAR